MIKIVKIGQIKRKSLVEEFDFFSNRIENFTKLVTVNVKESKHKDSRKIIDDESKRLSEKIKESDYSICLDKSGVRMDSVKLSKKIDSLMTNGKNIVFIIGGAFGLSEEIKSSSSMVLSFSDFTMQHDIVLIALLEQIYRSFTIMKGHPYHK